MITYEGFTRSELKAARDQLQDQLEEVLDERSLIIGQQNGHVSSKYISSKQIDLPRRLKSSKEELKSCESFSEYR